MKRLALLALIALVGGCRKPTTKAPPPPDPALTAVEQLEIAYLSTRDLYTKIQIMSELSDSTPAAAVEVIGRLFDFEQDTELREELLVSLMDVDGELDAKRELLEEALDPDLPEPVRLTAIDHLIGLGDKRSLPALQKYVADPSQEVRRAIEDALNELMDR